MKKFQIERIVMIVSMLLFVATIGLIISMRKIDKQTEDTTMVYNATVMEADVANTGNAIFAEISTKEYRTLLYISTNLSKHVRMENVENLKAGQTIFFSIENKKVPQMNKVEFVNITSLKTETETIFFVGGI